MRELYSDCTLPIRRFQSPCHPPPSNCRLLGGPSGGSCLVRRAGSVGVKGDRRGRAASLYVYKMSETTCGRELGWNSNRQGVESAGKGQIYPWDESSDGPRTLPSALTA